MDRIAFFGAPPAPACGKRRGYTAIELVLAVAIVGIIASIMIPSYRQYFEKANYSVAISDIVAIEAKIERYFAARKKLPLSLQEIGCSTLLDPWGSPYRYLNFGTLGGNGKGKMRKDKNLVPLNSEYDLYSMGPDGQSRTPLTAKASRDDIIRANNGRFIGLASDY